MRLTMVAMFAAFFGVLWTGCGTTAGVTEGMSWQFDATEGTFVTPDNASAIVDMLEDGLPVTLTITSADESSFDLLMSGSQDVPQDYCYSTAEMNGIALADDGSFSWGPQDFTLPNGTTQKSLTLAGSFNEDFSAMQNVSLQGTLVIDSIPDDFFAGDVDLCSVLAAYDIYCDDCDEGECLDLHVTGLSAGSAPDISLELVPLVDCHEQCPLSADNPDCTL